MHERLALSLRLLWVLALLASLGILLTALIANFTSAASGDLAGAPPPSVGLSISATLVSLGLACLLFWKRGNDPMALYLSFFLMLYGIVLSGPLEVVVAYWFPQRHGLGDQLVGVLISVPILVLILIFPTGRFTPRWTLILLPL